MRIIFIMIFFLVACQQAVSPDHEHDDGAVHSDDYDAPPTSDYTLWTDQMELFVEFPVLIVGRLSQFAAHFTVLKDHQPVSDGSVTVSLIKDNKGIRHTVDSPVSPGIFIPALQPKDTGIYELHFHIKTQDLQDQFMIKSVQVYSSLEEAEEILMDTTEDEPFITFLKEQAWKTDFLTEPVVEKEIHDIIPTSGIWRVAPSDYHTLIAPSKGQVTFNHGQLIEGSRVIKGQELMTISSAGMTKDNLFSEIQNAKAEYEKLMAEFERKKVLNESKIIPKAELEEVEKEFKIAKTNYETLSRGYIEGGNTIVAPFEGFIKAIRIPNGSFVDQGAPLATITSHKSSLLEIQVSPAYGAALQQIRDVWYQPATGIWTSLVETGGAILSVGKEVEPNKPLISIFAQVNNIVEMPEGSFTEAQIAIGDAGLHMVVPQSCLIEDYGSYSVIVQLTGESYERRSVSIGVQNGNEVEIKLGLKPGERVVTKGAYQVKMASMSGQVPSHGHVH